MSGPTQSLLTGFTARTATPPEARVLLGDLFLKINFSLYRLYVILEAEIAI